MATAKKTGNEAFDTMTAMTPEAFKDGYQRFANGFSELTELNKGSFEAVVASVSVFAKGIEKAAAEQTDFVKAQYEDGVSAAKAAAGSKSAQEAFEIQSEFVRGAVEKGLNQFNKLADHWMSTGKDAAEPLTARYSEFVEKVQTYRP